MMRNQRILISGASIAGPALAFWLKRHGFATTIVERALTIRPGGYAVDFRGTSLRILKQMGLFEEAQKREIRTSTVIVVDENDRKITTLPDGFTSGEFEILRGDLAHILYQATQRNTKYIFDDSIAALQEKDDGIDVRFKSGNVQQRACLLLC